MTPAPTVSDAAGRMYDTVRAYQDGDDDAGWLLLKLCEALSRTRAKVNEAIRHDDTGTGWRRLFDPNRCPEWALPWLAQAAGLGDVPASLTTSELRQLIVTAPGMSRGTPAALRAAIQRTLTGNKTVILRERDSGPYRLTVVTHADETPDPDASERALRAAKPAGIVLTLSVVTGWSIGEMETAYAGQTLTDLEGDFSDITHLEDNAP